MRNDFLMEPLLDIAVPLLINKLREQGGPTESDLQRVREFGPELAAHGDELLYRSRKSGVTAELFNKFADAIAVLAFQPGGVRIFGRLFTNNSVIGDEHLKNNEY